VEMGDRLWLSFFKAEGHRPTFVGWELGFSGGAAAVWCVRGRKWELSFLFSGKKRGPAGVLEGENRGCLGSLFCFKREGKDGREQRLEQLREQSQGALLCSLVVWLRAGV